MCTTTNLPYTIYEDYCRCDERCPKCGKKKKPENRPTITWRC